MKRFSDNNLLDTLAKLGIVLAMVNSMIVIVWFSMDWSVTSFYKSTQNLLAMAGLGAVMYLVILYQVRRAFSKKK